MSECKCKDTNLTELKAYIAEVQEKRYSDSYLIAVLHKTQELYGYLPQEIIDEISDEMNIPTAHIWGVATFYHYFNLKPCGKHLVSVCMGTACYVKGAGQLMDTIKQQLNVAEGDTTEDGLFTLQPARCLGACGLAPVVMIDDKIYGDLTPKKMTDLINSFRKKAGKK